MNTFIALLLTLAVAAHAATIPEPEVPKADVHHSEVSKPEDTKLDVTKSEKPSEEIVQPADAVPVAPVTTETPTAPLAVERDSRQLYPAGYPAGNPVYAPAAPVATLKAGVYNPYVIPAAAPAYPFNYYPSAYPNYPVQYYPLREESGAEDNSYWSSISSSLSNFGSQFGGYFSNYPSYYPAWFGGSESESSGAAAAPANSPAPTSEAENNNAALLKSIPVKPLKVQTFNTVNSIKPYAPAPIDNRFRYQPAQPVQPQFIVAGTPQFYGHYSAFQNQQDPSKLTAANNGAISSYLFLRNQPQLPVFQQNQQKFAAPATFQNGNVRDSHQQFVQYSKELQSESSNQVENVPSEENNAVVESAPSADSQQAPQEVNAQTANESEEPKKEASTGTGNSPIAQARPKGLAVAGEGGVADSSPSGTALVGKKGMALAAPSSIAIAGPDTPLTLTIDPSQGQHKTKKVKAKKPVARFTEARGYHIDYSQQRSN